MTRAERAITDAAVRVIRAALAWRSSQHARSPEDAPLLAAVDAMLEATNMGGLVLSEHVLSAARAWRDADRSLDIGEAGSLRLWTTTLDNLRAAIDADIGGG